MADLAFQPLTVLARMIQAGEVGSEELLDHYIARIDAHNGALNAIVASALDKAREAAKRADDDRAGGRIHGPLHGVPMTVKDAYEVEGLPSTGGVPELKDYVPAQDAVAVERLRRAGAIIIGKTNVPPYSGDWQSYNDVYGRTSNPWNLERTPGGSSGGAAAAISAGLIAGDIGSDIGGSIRLPAHFCGLFGHKSTWGVISTRGHIPPAPRAYSEADLAVSGPLGRSTSDLDMLFALLSGDPADAHHPHAPLRPARTADIKQLRVAVWAEEPDASIDTEVAAAVRMAGEALAGAGARVDWAARPDFAFADCLADYVMALSAIILADFPPKVLDQMRELAARADKDDRSYQVLQARGATMTYAQLLKLEARRRRIKDAWDRFFEDFDVVLCPPVSVPAIAHDTDRSPPDRRITVNGKEAPYLDLLHWASLATLAHLPASVAPVKRTDDGLPVGVQIIGNVFEDRTTLKVAAFLEDLLGGFVPPPDFA